MSVHDAVSVYRSRLVAMIESSGNIRRACREAGIHHSTFYRWRNETSPPVSRAARRLSWSESRLEARIVAAALAYPALGPLRVCDQLADDGVMVSASKVWRVLCRHRLNTRRLRYSLLGLHRDGVPALERAGPRPPLGVLDADIPGDLVQMDCFLVGSFKETRLGVGKARRGVIWQYTAIDVASSWCWAEIHATGANPSPVLTSQLAHRVAADLARWGWDTKAVSTDNGNEYRAGLFRDTLAELGVTHRFIRAGRPQSNGKVERVQGTLLEEFYQPTLVRYVEPSITGLRRDLADYLDHYNWQRRHRGKWNQGRTPAQIIQPKASLTP